MKIQEDFVDFGTVTLDMLDRYIANCHAVVHLVGDMSGSIARPRSTYANSRKSHRSYRRAGAARQGAR